MGLRRARSGVMAWLLFSLIAPLGPSTTSAQELAATPNVSAQSAYVFDATENVELLAENSQ